MQNNLALPSPQAFAETIYQRHYQQLRLYATKLANQYGYDLSLVDDWIQDLLYRTMSHFKTMYSGYQKSKLPYLLITIRNMVLEKGRVKKRHIRLEAFIIHTSPSSDDLHSLCFDHYYEHLEHQLGQFLKPEDTQIMMRYLDGFSYKEIGQQFGISESAAGVRIYRAKKQARRFLTKD